MAQRSGKWDGESKAQLFGTMEPKKLDRMSLWGGDSTVLQKYAMQSLLTIREMHAPYSDIINNHYEV